MKEFTINTPGDYVSLIPGDCNESVSTDTFSYLDINALFWKELFSDNNILEILEFGKLRFEHSQNIPIKIQAILCDTNIFYQNLKSALEFKLSKNVSKQLFLGCIETIEMFCELYTLCCSLPFKLTITEGFVHNKDSAEYLNEYCLAKNHNPYIDYIINSVVPRILEEKPDILWITGKPNIATFALAKLLKKYLPNIFISLCDFKTDYYSLYKIKDLLIRNTILFTIFDYILLFDNVNIREMLVNSLVNQSEMNNIPGLIYKERGEIICNDIPFPNDKVSIDNNKLDLKLFETNYCYWNKCSFCGINHKYCTQNERQKWNIPEAINILKERNKNGNRYIWLTDEAIPPIILKKLLIKFTENQFNFIWHFRTRIEPELLDPELIELVKNNGVKSIILGFESASERILRLMKKTFCSDYLSIAEKIVEKYTSNGIHIHFPVLIGFPTETNDERNYSLQFVEYLSKKYELFSYNINILELDISSDLFNRWYDYDIKQIKFPCLPRYFLGNNVDWDSNIDFLENIRTNQMKKQFRWYPNLTYISINAFYNLWERKRGVFYENRNNVTVPYIDLNNNYMLNSNTVFFKTITGEFCIYDFTFHNFILGGEIIQYVYYSFKKSLSIKEIIKKFSSFGEKNVMNFLNDLLKLNFIIQK